MGRILNYFLASHPGVAWVAALLSALLSFERLFRDDFIDGSLEQLMLTAQPLALTALAKVVAHWLLTGLPLILLSPDRGFIALVRSEYLVGIGAYTLSGHADFKLHWCNWRGIDGGLA